MDYKNELSLPKLKTYVFEQPHIMIPFLDFADLMYLLVLNKDMAANPLTSDGKLRLFWNNLLLFHWKDFIRTNMLAQCKKQFQWSDQTVFIILDKLRQMSKKNDSILPEFYIPEKPSIGDEELIFVYSLFQQVLEHFYPTNIYIHSTDTNDVMTPNATKTEFKVSAREFEPVFRDVEYVLDIKSPMNDEWARRMFHILQQDMFQLAFAFELDEHDRIQHHTMVMSKDESTRQMKQRVKTFFRLGRRLVNPKLSVYDEKDEKSRQYRMTIAKKR